jgi:hypothetical protein
MTSFPSGGWLRTSSCGEGCDDDVSQTGNCNAGIHESEGAFFIPYLSDGQDEELLDDAVLVGEITVLRQWYDD